MIKLALTNLGKYNEGELVYKWVELPIAENELEVAMAEIGINEEYEEYFITDWECDIKGIEISTYSNVNRLNDIALKLEECNNIELISAVMEAFNYTIDEAIEKVDSVDYIYLDNTYMNDEENLAYSYIESIGSLECALGERVGFYFDYEAFGRDLSFDIDMIIEDYEDNEKEEIYSLSHTELAEWYIDGLGDVADLGKETLERYFNYEAFGRDLSFDYIITSNGIAVLNY